MSSIIQFQTAMISLYNNISIYKNICFLPETKITKDVLKILKIKNFISKITTLKIPNSNKKILIVKPKYLYKRKNNKLYKKPLIKDIKLYSKASKRSYITLNKIKSLPNRNVRTYILSTNKGILNDQEAIQKNVGGELLISLN